MEIKGHNSTPPSHVHENHDTRKVESRGADKSAADSDRSGATDRVQLSDKAREVMRIRQAVDNVPDVREARVAALSASISSGTYNVQGRLVAQAMVRQAAFESVA